MGLFNDPFRWLQSATDDVSAAIGTDRSDSFLGHIGEVLATDKTAQAAAIAIAAYYGLPYVPGGAELAAYASEMAGAAEAGTLGASGMSAEAALASAGATTADLGVAASTAGAATGASAIGSGISSAFSGLTAGGIATGLQIAGGINSITGGAITNALGLGEKTPTAAEATTAADPFSQYRSKLAAQYAGALAPGGATNIEAMPGYTQFKTGVLDPAMQASQRTAAATGQLYSGGESAALQKIGQQGYSAFMTDYLNRLSTGSGASNNPLGGAEFGSNMQSDQQKSFMQGIGALGQGVSGLSRMFGNTSNTGGADFGVTNQPAGAMFDINDFS